MLRANKYKLVSNFALKKYFFLLKLYAKLLDKQKHFNHEICFNKFFIA